MKGGKSNEELLAGGDEKGGRVNLLPLIFKFMPGQNKWLLAARGSAFPGNHR